jgi:hypothetical protein
MVSQLRRWYPDDSKEMGVVEKKRAELREL